MILLFPTNPGFSQEWTVSIDFVKNGFPKIQRVFDSWEDGITFIYNYLSEDVRF